MKNLFLIILFILFLFPLSVNAIEYGGIGGKPANPDPNNPRTKSIFIFTLNPGETAVNELLVVNNTKERKNLLIYATDSLRSSDGNFACKQFVEEKVGVGSWIKFKESEITLDSGTNKRISFTIESPKSASVGEENGCILIQEKNEVINENSGVNLSLRTGIRVVVTIPGEQVRDIKYVDYSAKLNDSGNLSAIVSVKNNGNVSVDTDIFIESKYLFGIPYNLIDNQYPILRGEVTTYNFEIPKPFWGGPITLSTFIKYDNSKESSVGIDSDQPNIVVQGGLVTIFVVPELGAILVYLIIISIFIIIVYLIIKKQKKNRFVRNNWLEYIVKDGDNINIIANRYGIGWKEIAKINKLKPPYLLGIGAKLLVPPLKKFK